MNLFLGDVFERRTFEVVDGVEQSLIEESCKLLELSLGGCGGPDVLESWMLPKGRLQQALVFLLLVIFFDLKRFESGLFV